VEADTKTPLRMSLKYSDVQDATEGDIQIKKHKKTGESYATEVI
jgi:hypothetical protein